ncbi:hypothetical protein [Neisseria sp.]|uniref:hypothetical protein n=1 Tax=Neisseria sp. TaxID=192066 RepID=UPI0035A01AA5
MPKQLIRDYLQTQGLKLPQDEVYMAVLTLRAVMDSGAASIDKQVLWHASEALKLSDQIDDNPANEALLKQVFMALDSVFSRSENIKSAAVYALMPSENGLPSLVCLTAQGQPLASVIAVDDTASQNHLAARAALTGWMNIADDIPQWLEHGDLQGEHNLRGKSQLSAPVCSASGAVLGVVHAEYPEIGQTDETAQIGWLALALALQTPLQALLQREAPEQKQQEY